MKGFRRAEITVSIEDSEPRKVLAHVSRSGVFAIHKLQLHDGEAKGRDYVVTHVPTGMKMDPTRASTPTLPLIAEFVSVLETHPDAKVWTEGPFALGQHPPKEWSQRAGVTYQAAREALLQRMGEARQ